MSKQQKPNNNVVPLKSKVRSGIAWPELTQGGAPKKGSMMNVRKAIDELGLEVGYDVFLGRYTVQGSDMQAFVGEVNDKVARKFRELSLLKLRYEPGAEAAREGLMRACEEHMYRSVRGTTSTVLSGMAWNGWIRGSRHIWASRTRRCIAHGARSFSWQLSAAFTIQDASSIMCWCWRDRKARTNRPRSRCSPAAMRATGRNIFPTAASCTRPRGTAGVDQGRVVL